MDLVPKGPHRLVKVSGRWTVAVEHRDQDIGGYFTDLYTFAGTPEALEASQIQELGDYIKLPASAINELEPEQDPMTDDVGALIDQSGYMEGAAPSKIPEPPVKPVKDHGVVAHPDETYLDSDY